MWPLVIPVLLGESDITARAALEQAFASSITQQGQGSSLTGAEGGFRAQTRDDMSSYGIELAGLYARLVTLRIAEGEDPPPADNFSVNLATNGGWQLSPHTHMNASASGFLASRFGVRADDALAARDPFMGDRTEYTVDGGLAWSAIASRTNTWTLSGGYRQSGAVAADNEEAVGMDVHQGRAVLSSAFEIGPTDTLTPELRYQYSYFYNALLDIYLTRGKATVNGGTAFLSEQHAFSRTTRSKVGGGVTVANQNPLVESDDLVVSPEVALEIAHVRRRTRYLAGYDFTYTSLGPRIGFGQAHQARVEMTTFPLPGAAFRDFALTGVARFQYGYSPIKANPPLVLDTGAAPPPLEGTISTVTGVAGIQVEYPVTAGLALLGGFDLEYVRADFDPVPPTGEPEASLRTIAMLGIAGVISSDPKEMYRKDPQDEEDSRPPANRRDDPATERIDDLTKPGEGPTQPAARDASRESPKRYW